VIRNKNILVTGGRGFIGSNLADELSKNNNIKIYDIVDKKDIRNYKLLEKELKGIDYVFHFAGLVSVEESIKEPEKTIETNVIGSLNVLKASLKHRIKKIVFSSSCAVYGDFPKNPKGEDMPLRPESPYATSKIIIERLLKMFHEKHGLKTISLRYFNVYGPKQNPNSQYAAVVPIFIKRSLENKDLIIHGDGKQTRDFIFIEDVIKANVLAAENDSCGIFNIGSGTETNINSLAKLTIELTKSKSKIKYDKPRKGDIIHSSANISKAMKILGFKPKYNLKNGLEKTIKRFDSYC